MVDSMIDSMLEGIQAVIFDLDGTLVDSMWMWERIDIDYLKRHKIECPMDLQGKVEGMSFSEVAIYFKDRFSLIDSVEQIKRDWNDMAYNNYLHEVPLKSGRLELLAYLREKGLKLGIATSNSLDLVNAVVDSLGIRFYFDEIHTACEVEKGKPSPDIYLFVAKCLGVAPKHCLVFEDLPPGIIAGKSAGMKTCAVPDEYSAHLEKEKSELADYYYEV
jgi:HAD superfamily hydrolase (TIGR01509 family)